MLASGEIPAAIGVQGIDSPDVKPLVSNPREAGFNALREHGLYPINHTIVVRNDVLAAHPEVASELVSVFTEAKYPYVERLAAGHLENADDTFFRDVMDVMGDPLPYGIESNRAMLDAAIGHAVEQGIIPQRVGVDDLFAV
jgi:4,5-dihydroxyphthalate decarboxylase